MWEVPALYLFYMKKRERKRKRERKEKIGRRRGERTNFEKK
jgi:hypothetical protein